MQHADFGEGVDTQAMLEYLIKAVPRVCATDAQLLKLQHYETAFGIHDHENTRDKGDPLALIRMHEAERTNGLLFERIKRFKDRKIHQYFGLDLVEFLRLPREVCDYLEELGLSQLRDDNQTGEAQIHKLQQLSGVDL